MFLSFKALLVTVRFLFICALLASLPSPPAWADGEKAPEPAFNLEGPKIREYDLPTKNSLPYGIGLDSKGRIWYTAQSANRIGFLDPRTNTVKEFVIPSTAALPKSKWKYDSAKKAPPKPEDVYNIFSVGSPGELIVDSKDRIWFVEVMGNRLGVFDPETEKFKEYEIPTPNSQPYSLAEDRQGNIWFVEKNTNKIGKLDFTKKKVQEYSIAKGDHKFTSIAIDARQNIWVTDSEANSIIMFNPSDEKIKRYPIYEPVSLPRALYIAPNGQIWFSMAKKRKIGMLDPASGIISNIVLPSYNSVPQDIAVNKAGQVWYIDNFTNKVGFFDMTTAKLREWDIPTINAGPMQVVLDKKGGLWFTESGLSANKIARLDIASVPKESGETPERPGNKKHEPGEGTGWGLGYPAGILLAIVLLILGIKAFTKKKPS